MPFSKLVHPALSYYQRTHRPFLLPEKVELVVAEEEEKNWKGIIISLVVIVFILSMIILAIALITPGKVKEDPGEPFTFSLLANKSNDPSQEPVFQMSGASSYVIKRKNTNGEDELVLVNLEQEDKSASRTDGEPLVSAAQLREANIKEIQGILISPDGNYIIIQCTSHGEANFIYNRQDKTFIDDSHFKIESTLDYVSWIGRANELVYITSNNEMLYKSSPTASPKPVAMGDTIKLGRSAASSQVVAAESASLVWMAPDQETLVYGKITQNEVKNTKRRRRSTKPQTINTNDVLSLHVVKPASSEDGGVTLNMTSLSGLDYLLSLIWVRTSKVMMVFANEDAKIISYVICQASDGQCEKNYEYSDPELNWISPAGPPAFSGDNSKYFVILPDPFDSKRRFNHLAEIQTDKTSRPSPTVKFLNNYSWSDEKILAVLGGKIFYFSTGKNHTHRHLYVFDLQLQKAECASCNLDVGSECNYVDASLSKDFRKIILSCQGPDLPSHHLIDTRAFLNGTKKTTQIAKEQYNRMKDALEKVKLPKTRFLTIPLDSGFEASVKLSVPPEYNTEKIYTYGLVIRLSERIGEQQSVQKFLDPFAIYLVKSEGYIVADVDVRGSANRGYKLTQAVYGSIGVREAHDIKEIVKHIKDNHEAFRVNDSMVAVIGKGYGGFVALHAIQKGAANCGVVVSPVSDPSYLDKFQQQQYMGEVNAEKSPSELIYDCMAGDGCTTPNHYYNFLLIHGTADNVVPWESSLKLMRKLQLAGFEFKQQLYPEVGHSIEDSSVYKHYYQSITNYLSECFSQSAMWALEHKTPADAA